MDSYGIVRKYGKPEYSVVLVHGGPGAPGELAPVANELLHHGICSLEPFQSADSINSQIEELRNQIEAHVKAPLVLIGYSWGAILALLTAAKYPHLAKKVILISSGLFVEEGAEKIMETRLNRLSEDKRREFERLMDAIKMGEEVDDSSITSRFHSLLVEADSYDPISEIPWEGIFQSHIFQKVWPELVQMRGSGELLEQVSHYKGPVVAIHGDYDPHPFQGIQYPLENTLADFTFVLLENCGHSPWIERKARNHFYGILKTQILG